MSGLFYIVSIVDKDGREKREERGEKRGEGRDGDGLSLLGVMDMYVVYG